MEETRAPRPWWKKKTEVGVLVTFLGQLFANAEVIVPVINRTLPEIITMVGGAIIAIGFADRIGKPKESLKK